MNDPDFAPKYNRLLALIGEMPTPEMAAWVRRTFLPTDVPEVLTILRDGMGDAAEAESDALTFRNMHALVAALERAA